MLASDPCSPETLDSWSAQFRLDAALPCSCLQAPQQHAQVSACVINPVFAAQAGTLLAGAQGESPDFARRQFACSKHVLDTPTGMSVCLAFCRQLLACCFPMSPCSLSESVGEVMPALHACSRAGGTSRCAGGHAAAAAPPPQPPRRQLSGEHGTAGISRPRRRTVQLCQGHGARHQACHQRTGEGLLQGLMH